MVLQKEGFDSEYMRSTFESAGLRNFFFGEAIAVTFLGWKGGGGPCSFQKGSSEMSGSVRDISKHSVRCHYHFFHTVGILAPFTYCVREIK